MPRLSDPELACAVDTVLETGEGLSEAGVLAGIPVNRRFEVAVLWALALLAAALGLLSVARASGRRRREIRLAASGGLVSLLVLGAAWQGAASQAATPPARTETSL